jgi:hypothetical protein
MFIATDNILGSLQKIAITDNVLARLQQTAIVDTVLGRLQKWLQLTLDWHVFEVSYNGHCTRHVSKYSYNGRCIGT